MKVMIHNFEDHEPDMLAACIERVRRFYGIGVPGAVQPPNSVLPVVDIWVETREKDGTLQYPMRLPYFEGTSAMTIVALQREFGATVEFHS